MNFNKYYFVALFFMLFAIGQIQASEKLYDFVVWLSSGEQVNYSVSENPKVSHDGTNLVVTTSSTSVTYDVANVSKFTIGENTGVEDIAQNSTGIVKKGDTLYLSGFEVNASVVISDISGKCVYTANTDEDGCLSIDLSDYPAGIYVVSANRFSCKIIKN